MSGGWDVKIRCDSPDADVVPLPPQCCSLGGEFLPDDPFSVQAASAQHPVSIDLCSHDSPAFRLHNPNMHASAKSRAASVRIIVKKVSGLGTGQRVHTAREVCGAACIYWLP